MKAKRRKLPLQEKEHWISTTSLPVDIYYEGIFTNCQSLASHTIASTMKGLAIKRGYIHRMEQYCGSIHSSDVLILLAPQSKEISTELGGVLISTKTDKDHIYEGGSCSLGLSGLSGWIRWNKKTHQSLISQTHTD